MPRVYSKRKSKGGTKEYRCHKCGEAIKPTERYYQWSFRHGGTYYRHTSCGYPRPSDLTQSRMASVYLALEGFEDSVSTFMTADDAQGSLADVSAAAYEVAEEYRSAAEYFGGAGENADRADELEGWASDLDGVQFPELLEFVEENFPDDATTDVDAATSEQLEAWREAVQAEIPECPL